MKKTLIILLASTALTAAVGLPALGAISSSDWVATRPLASMHDSAVDAPTVMHVADSDSEDDHGFRLFGGGDDDEEDDCDDDGHSDDDDGASACAPGSNPAPAGTVSPPQNGLFSNGAAPAVQVN